MRTRIAAVLLLLLIGASAAWAQSPATQPDGRVRHFAAYLNGQRIGHAVERTRSLQDGSTEFMMDYHLALGVEGKTVKVSLGERQVESPDGRPVGLHSRQQFGSTPVTRDGVIRDGKLLLTITQGAQQVKREQPWDARVLFQPAVRRLLAEKLRADGDEAVVWAYDSDFPGTGFAPVTYKRIGAAPVELQGRTARALRVTESSPVYPAVRSDWFNDDWDVVATEETLGPQMVLRIEACTEAFALGRFDAPEIFNTALIRLAEPLADPEKVRSLRLTLVYAQPLEQPLVLPDTERQKAVESTVERLVVELNRPDYPQPPAGGEPPMTDELKAYLQPTELYNADDPQIRSAAREAIPTGTRDPLARARALRDWVAERLTFKQMGVIQGTASEVLRSRTGDCTEHAALLVALARASGVPARGVSGLVYADRFAGQRGVLAFHEWAQLHVHGRWVDFDAAIGGEPAGATRLALVLGRADGKFDVQAGAANIYKLFANVKSVAADRVRRD